MGKKLRRKNFKLASMAVETNLSEERIKEILWNPKKDQSRNAQKSKLLSNGVLKKYPTLASAREVCEFYTREDPEYAEAYEVWEWYAFIKLTRPYTKSILVDILEDCPKGSFPESLAVQRLAAIFGFQSKEDLD